MLTGLTWLLACQLVGEVLVRLLDAPVPGPVVGMVVLLVALRWRARRDGDGDGDGDGRDGVGDAGDGAAPSADAPVLRAADALLRHLQLLFVPAGVGVVVHLATLREHALPLGVGLVGSWAVGLGVVAGVALGLERLLGRGSHR